MRVYELARELRRTSKELLSHLKEMGLEVKSHSSSLSGEAEEKLREEFSSSSAPPAVAEEEPVAPAEETAPPPPSEDISLTVKFPLTVRDLAEKLEQKPNVIIKKLMDLGVFAGLNQFIDEETAIILGHEYGYELTSVLAVQAEKEPQPGGEEPTEPSPPKKEKDLRPRPPVVTLMGHIDHGKTSLLDSIRHSRITSAEAGGITQHIGAYQVKTDRGVISFVDTPGHTAFTTMRARGAAITDIVVLVVAADDGVMPTTLEAIDHARAAGVPIVVAINKIDKKVASPERVLRQLAEQDLVPESMGGNTVCVPVSAKTGEGLDHLLEMILLQAEIMELKADPLGPARGVVVEAKLTAAQGPVATLMVKEGTLKRGDNLICDVYSGKVKSMFDDRRETLKSAGPSVPVEVLGIMGVPFAGAKFEVVESTAAARAFSEERQTEKRGKNLQAGKQATLEDFFQKLSSGEVKDLRLIIKGDVQGSIEALNSSLREIAPEQVDLKIIHSAVGSVTESDVMLASASGAIILGFQVGAESRIRKMAAAEGVDLRSYKVIYEAVDEVKKSLEGLLEPKVEEVRTGQAQVKEIFKISKVGLIAGCVVEKGKFARSDRVRVFRDDQPIADDTIVTLKHFKETVEEVAAGSECGLSLANFREYEPGDILEAYRIKTTQQTL